jgi:putative NADH-flavin reductase
MNIVIFGATGPLGRRITQAALARGYQVTAVVRTAGRLDPHPGLREVTGDVLDPGSVAAAIPGHDAVISALGHSSPSSAGPQPLPRRLPHHLRHANGRGEPADLDLQSRRRRCPRPLRIRVRTHLRAATLAGRVRRQGTQEAIVAASHLDWTIVRPARLTNGPATGRLRAQARLPVTIRDSISRADVAQFVVDELEHGEHLLTAPTVTAT